MQFSSVVLCNCSFSITIGESANLHVLHRKHKEISTNFMVGSSYVLEKKKKTKIQQAKNMGNTTPFQHTPLFVGWKVFSTIFPES